MTIDRLRALYRLILARQRPPSAIGRLAIGRILALAERQGGIADRLRTLDTVMADREYMVELEILRAAIGTRRRFGHRLEWTLGNVGLAIAATLLLSVGLTAIARTWSTRPDAPRGGNSVVVQLVTPTERVDARTIMFTWKPVRGAQDYEIEVLDADGLSTFVSTVRGTSVRLPTSVRLLPGAEYRWWVVARRADGSRVGAVPRRLRVDDGTNGSGAGAERMGPPQPYGLLARAYRAINTPAQANS